ncbi:MAG TPA: hypothetical protein VHC70_00785 [Phycisphaerales bacterium]|nr:hypothetical protein [Phycisphaerales bacterium]
MRFTMLIGVGLLASILAGCGRTDCRNDALLESAVRNPPRAVTLASSAQRSALLDRIKSLAGTWESADEKGQMHVSSIFTVTSNGSAVREVMLPGTPHEMTNMYTMDGPTLLVTHYCAQGNQPRMRARADGTAPDRIHFAYDGVGNYAGGDQLYMGDLTIIFRDDDHIAAQWGSYVAGKPAAHNATFELTRRR